MKVVHTINLLPEWTDFEDNKRPLHDVINKLITELSDPKLNALLSDINKELFYQNLIALSDDDEPDVDEFDIVMSDVYDWADVNHLWIKTF